MFFAHRMNMTPASEKGVPEGRLHLRMKQVLRRPFPPIMPEKAGQSVKDCPAFVRLSGRKIIGAKLLCTAKAEVLRETRQKTRESLRLFAFDNEVSHKKNGFAAASSLSEGAQRYFPLAKPASFLYNWIR